MFAMITPRGFGWWWRTRLGGREPSSRERSRYEEAFDSLQARASEELPAPRSWFVLDTPERDGRFSIQRFAEPEQKYQVVENAR